MKSLSIRRPGSHARLDHAALAILLVLSCSPPNPPGPREPNPLEAPPVDTSKVRSAEEAAAWSLQHPVTADLDGDGAPERIVLASDVTVGPDGRPLWEDGHRWALVIEAADSRRTLAYAAFVPRGFVEAAILAQSSDGTRAILILERTPERHRALEIGYLGPGEARSRSAAHYQIESWLPGAASPP